MNLPREKMRIISPNLESPRQNKMLFRNSVFASSGDRVELFWRMSAYRGFPTLPRADHSVNGVSQTVLLRDM